MTNEEKQKVCDKVGDVSSHFQMAVTLSLFFPLVWQSFLSNNQVDVSSINSEIVAWGYFVATAVVAYIIFEIFKRSIRPFFLKIIDIVVFLWVALLGLMFYVLFDTRDGFLVWHKLVMQVSVLSIMFSPVVMAVLVVTSWSMDRANEVGMMSREIYEGLKGCFVKKK